MIKGMFKEITKLRSEVTGQEYSKPLLMSDIRQDLDKAIDQVLEKAKVRSYTGFYFEASMLDKKELLRVLRLYEEYL